MQHNKKPLHAIGLLATLVSCVSCNATPSQLSKPAVKVQLASKGKAALPVVVAASADARVKTVAQTLAKYLGQISGAAFEVKEGDGKSGIAVGVSGDFALPALGKDFKTNDATRREDYILRSHAGGVYLVGASPIAAEHAVWDLLHRLGYRQYFPSEKWEIVPSTPELAIAADVTAHPDYAMRHIWYHYGELPERRPQYEDWVQKNRMTTHRARGGVIIETGHMWDEIVRAHKAEFAAHPEYLCSSEPGLEKFCVSNPGLQKLVINHALDYFAKNPNADSISMDPSDGGGWECEKCDKEFENVTDRVVTLANIVAEAVNQKYPGKFIGIYAYNEHSPPPTVKVHPKVAVNVATAFIKGGYTIEQLLDGWKKQGVQQFGIREYYSVNAWDRDLPGQGRGGDTTYIRETLPRFHHQGAKFITSESSDNWGPHGLGYYLASRIMWETDETKNADAITTEFLSNSFGPAADAMREYYRLLDGNRKQPLSDDLLGRMYRALGQAREKTTDEKILARLDDLALYTRYVELFHAYATAVAPNRQKYFEETLRFAYRIRQTGMVSSMALYRDLPTRDKQVALPENAAWEIPEGQNPWKSSEAFTRAQIDEFIKNGIANHKLLDFETVAFSDKLVPATALNLPKVPVQPFNYTRDTHRYWVWIENGQLAIRVKTGRVYKNLGNTSLTLFSPEEVTGNALDTTSITPDDIEKEIVLKTRHKGLHRLELRDATSGTQLFFPDDAKVVVESSTAFPANYMDRWDLYFYVPKGTKVVGGWRDGPGQLVDSSGKVVREFEGWLGQTQEYFSVPVEPGQDGKAWKFQFSGMRRVLLTVPPYFARSPDQLLLPQEVVQKDAP